MFSIQNLLFLNDIPIEGFQHVTEITSGFISSLCKTDCGIAHTQ